MPKSVQIIIPNACHENWNEMTWQEQGRFCNACQKQVIDFSGMSDKELLAYISQPGISSCGRFSNDQLNRNLKPPQTRKHFSGALVVWNVLLATLLITKANAQEKPVKKKKPVCEQHTVLPRAGNIKLMKTDSVMNPKDVINDSTYLTPKPVINELLLLKGKVGGYTVIEKASFPKRIIRRIGNLFRKN